MRHFIFIFITLSIGLSCVSYNRKAFVKRDRYGESPVIDMRSGQSALERTAQNKISERKREKYRED